MSDPVTGAPSLETRMDDVRAVMDAVGSRRAAFYGLSEGAAMSILFAATYPERTAALIVRSCSPRTLWAPDFPWGRTDADYKRETEQALRVYEPLAEARAAVSALGMQEGEEVHTGARVAAHAVADEVLVSSTVKDLVAGSGIAFQDRGVHELKGIPGDWRLFAAV